jgi:ABC-type polysaccharide/polyol phosphate export permease
MSASLRQLILVRYREFFREPEAVFWVYFFPLLLATGLGIAFRERPVERVVVGWAAGPRGRGTATAMLQSDSAITVQEFVDSASAATALRNGRIALLVVPDSAGLRYRYDDNRPESRLARLRVDAALQRGAGRADPLAAHDELVRERGSRYIDFLIPGLIGMNLMGSGIWASGFAIVDARKRKLLKRLAATPMPRAEYLASFLIAQLSLLVLEVGGLLAFGVLAFGVPMRGSLLSFAAICVTAALAFGAIGLLVASRPRTIEGASGLMNLVMMPMWVLSGVFFSSSNFPAAVQPIIKILPLTAVNDSLRAIMLEGAGLGQLIPQLLILAAWLVLAFSGALKLFRWK